MNLSNLPPVLRNFLAYPSDLWLAVQAAALCFVMIWVSWIGFFAALCMVGVYSIIRFIRVVNKTGPQFANPRSVFITGASSGIGEHLAYKYVMEGVQNIYITGRNQERLDSVVEEIRRLGESSKKFKNVKSYAVDVTNREEMRRVMEEADTECNGIDVVIANSGLSASVLPADMPKEDMTRHVMDVNVNGVFNTVFPLHDRFISRKKGQFVLMASIAGIAALPGNNPYGASKAAVIAYGNGLRSELKKISDNLSVTVINPGFVRSGLTKERAEKVGLPFLVETDVACELMYDAICEGLGVFTYPLPTYFGGWCMRMLPSFIHEKLSSVVSNLAYPTKLDRVNTKAN